MIPPFIYALVDPHTEQVRYVGMTRNNKSRPYKHTKNARDGKDSHLCNWIRELLSKNLEPIIRILEHCVADITIHDLGLRERYYIQQLREAGHSLTNKTEGGDGGWQHDLETRTKIKAARARQVMPAYTEERRAKLSATLKGHTVSPETRAKLSTHKKPKQLEIKYPRLPRKGLPGYKHTAETRAKMSLAKKGKTRAPHTLETRAKLSQSIAKMWADGKRNKGVA